MLPVLDKHIVGAETLDEIRARFALSETELATMFNVSRPALAKWRTRGVPVQRVADVDRVLELARYFHWKVKPQRVPQIVRTPGKGLDGKTVLETIAERARSPSSRISNACFPTSRNKPGALRATRRRV